MFQMYPLYYHTLYTDSVLCKYFVHYGNEETELMMGAEIWPDTPQKRLFISICGSPPQAFDSLIAESVRRMFLYTLISLCYIHYYMYVSLPATEDLSINRMNRIIISFCSHVECIPEK